MHKLCLGKVVLLSEKGPPGNSGLVKVYFLKGIETAVRFTDMGP